MKDFAKRAIRHGEIVLFPCGKPKGAVKEMSGKEYIVGHSETGHHHVAVGNLEVYTKDGIRFLRMKEDGVINHLKTIEKHETKTVFKGWYEIKAKQAFDYFEGLMRRVRD